MTADQSVFGNTPSDPTIVDTTPVYEQLVGQGKKFQDNEALAKSKLESDKFIDDLKRKNSELLQDLQSKLSAEDLAKQLREEFSAQRSDTNPPVGPKPEELAKLVSDIMSRKESEKSVQGNLQATEQALIGKFGTLEAAQKAVKDKAAELGVTQDYLKETAAQAPKAFYGLMGLNELRPITQDPTSLQRTSVNSQAFVPAGSPETLKAHYDNLRKTKPTEYYSGKVQMEIFNLIKEGKLEL